MKKAKKLKTQDIIDELCVAYAMELETVQNLPSKSSETRSSIAVSSLVFSENMTNNNTQSHSEIGMVGLE